MPQATLRLFVAVYPPIEQAAAWLDRLRSIPLGPCSVVPVEQVHLTIQFIGSVAERDLPAVEESIERSASGLGAFHLTPASIATFPPKGEARLVAAECDAPPPLLELHRRLAQRLARNVRERAGDRFTPHFTLARFKGGTRVDRWSEPLEGPGFPVDEIKLVRSILKPSGAEHAAIRSMSLR